MLSKFGRADTVFDELKAIYYPQLREGPGTLWENEVIETSSRCHGFTSHAGFQLTRDILGLTPPNEADKTIVIAPNPMNLRWARGVAKTGCGCMSVSFINENGNFTLNAVVPSAYKCEVKLPSCVKGLEDENVKIDIVYV